MTDLRETLAGLATHALRWRILGSDLGMHLLEIAKFAEQRVELLVRNFGPRLIVVERVVPLNLFAQPLCPLSCGFDLRLCHKTIQSQPLRESHRHSPPANRMDPLRHG